MGGLCTGSMGSYINGVLTDVLYDIVLRDENKMSMLLLQPSSVVLNKMSDAELDRTSSAYLTQIPLR